MSTEKQLTDPQKLWIAALRSGEYKQGREMLSDGDSYCCLGVLCEIAIQHGVGIEKVARLGERVRYNGELSVAPKEAVKWVGLHAKNGKVNSKLTDSRLHGGGELSAANDRGATFAEIADFIEAHPEAVFA